VLYIFAINLDFKDYNSTIFIHIEFFMVSRGSIRGFTGWVQYTCSLKLNGTMTHTIPMLPLPLVLKICNFFLIRENFFDMDFFFKKQWENTPQCTLSIYSPGFFRTLNFCSFAEFEFPTLSYLL